MGDHPLRAFHQRVFLVAILLHAIAAWFSSGYYADDEHYQVIAFAQQRMGELPANELPWEYDAHIRSAWLPSLACAAIGAGRAWLTTDPFIIAFLLRAITAICALAVVRRFITTALPLVKIGQQRLFIGLSWSLWFLPYQHVRFASETWTGLLFLAGATTMLSADRRKWTGLVTGALFGLSLQVKPAMIIACLGASAWWAWNSNERIKRSAIMLGGMILAIAAGALVDLWFYRDFHPTLWNYMRLAVLGDDEHTFEVYPWYSYFAWLVKYGIWPIGMLLLVALLWLSYRMSRSWLMWSIWPYLIVLSIIPHKEVRFLFPLVDLAPLALVLAWQEVKSERVRKVLRQRAVSFPIIVVNTIGLWVSCSSAAGGGRTRLAEALWRNGTGQATAIGYDFDDDRIWKARIPSFYLRSNVRDLGVFHPCAHSLDVGDPFIPEEVIMREPDAASSACVPDRMGYVRVAASEPDLSRLLLLFYDPHRPGRSVLYQREARTSYPSEL